MFNLRVILSGLIVLLTACTSQAPEPVVTEKPVPEIVPQKPAHKETTEPELEDFSVHNIAPSALTVQKNGKTLELVRVMEGGACKNDDQGVTGMFMLYADPADVERIKKQRGEAVFAQFEQTISDFSSNALQQAVNLTELSKSDFILDEVSAQERTAQALIKQFNTQAATAVSKFQQDTTLTIAVEPDPESLKFYLKGCFK